MSDDIAFMSAATLAGHYQAGTLSPREVAAFMLARISRYDRTLNAFQFTDPETTLAMAAESEQRWRAGAALGPLDGVPVSVKDLLLTKGWPTLSGSRATSPDGPWTQDAPAVARLRAAGAVFLGKTTTPEFGWKGITDSALAGFTRNPWDPARSPGGSSGGSGAAVAAGLGPLSLGTDGGGSIRIPASFCGLFGFKPTFGRVPNYPSLSPFITLASSGPLAREVGDMALMLDVIAAPDPRDWHALPPSDQVFSKVIDDGISGLKIAYSPELGGAQVAPEVRALTDRAVQRLEDCGAHVEAVGPLIDPLKTRFAEYWVLGFAYTMKAYPEAARALMDPGFVDLALRGRECTLDDYYAGHMARIELGQHFNLFHQDYDLLVTPTMPLTAPLAETAYATPQYDRWEHSVPFTLPFNLTGQPAANIPCGVTAAGHPVGLQVVGAKYADALVLRACRAYEQEAPEVWPPAMLQAALDRL